MAIEYPKGLPLPLRDGYNFQSTNAIRRTEMDSGRARQRVEFDDTPAMGNMRFIFTQAEASLFEYWAARIVKASWFTMTLLTPLGFGEHEVRFTETPTGGELRGKFHWAFSAKVELRFQPLLPPGWAELAPDWILMADIFDIAMNKEWPEA